MSPLQSTWKKIERQQLLTCLGLVFLALLTYANTFPGHFFLDDHPIVKLNPVVEQLDFVKSFTSDYWGEAANSGLYRPLTILSLALNRSLFGSTPTAFHVVNLVLHALVVLLVFLQLQRCRIDNRIAGLAAALFAVHPIHTEVINMAVGRSELLAAFWLLAALWVSAGFAGRPRLTLLAVFLGYAAALLSKEHAIVLLLLLPLCDWLKSQGESNVFRQRRSLYLLLAGETLLWLVWRSWGVVRTVPRVLVEPAINPLLYMEPLPRILTALKIQLLYLWKLLWPADLHALYSGTGSIQPVTGVGIVLMTALLLALLGWGCYRQLLPAWGVALTLLCLFPTANLLLLVGVGMAERLVYFPSIWFSLAIAALLAMIPRRRLFLAISLGVLLALMTTTWLRNRDFASEVTLWQDEVDRDPQNVMAWLALATSWDDKVQAEAYFRSKLALVPDLAEGQSVYAGALYALGKYDDDVIAFALRAEADPKTDLLANKFLLARAYLRKGEYAEALRWLEKSRPLYGSYGIFWEVRGMVLEGLQRFPEAIDAYRRAEPLPADSEVPMRLGNLLMSQGRYAEAEVVYRRGLDRRERAEGWNGLGVALALQGKAEARQAFARAVSLDPSSSKYRENYQRALEEKVP